MALLGCILLLILQGGIVIAATDYNWMTIADVCAVKGEAAECFSACGLNPGQHGDVVVVLIQGPVVDLSCLGRVPSIKHAVFVPGVTCTGHVVDEKFALEKGCIRFVPRGGSPYRYHGELRLDGRWQVKYLPENTRAGLMTPNPVLEQSTVTPMAAETQSSMEGKLSDELMPEVDAGQVTRATGVGRTPDHGFDIGAEDVLKASIQKELSILGIPSEVWEFVRRKMENEKRKVKKGRTPSEPQQHPWHWNVWVLVSMIVSSILGGVALLLGLLWFLGKRLQQNQSHAAANSGAANTTNALSQALIALSSQLSAHAQTCGQAVQRSASRMRLNHTPATALAEDPWDLSMTSFLSAPTNRSSSGMPQTSSSSMMAPSLSSVSSGVEEVELQVMQPSGSQGGFTKSRPSLPSVPEILHMPKMGSSLRTQTVRLPLTKTALKTARRFYGMEGEHDWVELEEGKQQVQTGMATALSSFAGIEVPIRIPMSPTYVVSPNETGPEMPVIPDDSGVKLLQPHQ